MSLHLVSDKNEGRLPIVAIDGPAGAGKSTAARLLAMQLGFILCDTGALYRCLAYLALEENVSLDDEEALGKLCSEMKVRFGKLEKQAPNESRVAVPRLPVYCNEIDVTDSIRQPEIGVAASRVSQFPAVRNALLDRQREFGEKGGVVMEGRDIGTVIFPHAEIKFFLTASVKSRAERRQRELQDKGVDCSLDNVMQETASRDEQDSNREISPLKEAEDSIRIDSSEKGLMEVVASMAEKVRAYLREQNT